MLYDKVLKNIRENSLIPPKSTVYAAVSGGADSVCLLEILKKLESELDITLRCAHFNHNLRGSESDGDEEYVRTLCERLNVPFFRGEADVAALSKGKSLEDTARDARYAFFESLMSDDSTFVATAHTQNDNVETFFINLLRGSSGRGLCAIPPKRGHIVRPMLDVSRDEILLHLETLRIEYKTDSTNSDTGYLRNFIRLEVLPQLCARSEINPYKTVSHAISNLRTENSALDGIADLHTDFRITALSALPDAVLWRVLTKKLEKEYALILDSNRFDAVKSILQRANARVQIRGGIYAVTENGVLHFRNTESESICNTALKHGENQVGSSRILIKKQKEIYSALTNAYIDCDKIGNNLFAGARQNGDTFFAPGRKSSSSLKKLLINDKIPRFERDRIIIIRDERGKIVFVQGYGADTRFSADKNSKNIISIEII